MPAALEQCRHPGHTSQSEAGLTTIIQENESSAGNGDDPYTNLDLDTAEELLIQAGKKELAVALRYQAQGVRNLVQGEWGQSFVNTVGVITEKNTERILAEVTIRLDQQLAIAQQILATAQAAQKTAKQALTVSKAGTARLGKLESRMDASEIDRADLRTRLERIERIMAERPEQRAAEHQALLKAIRGGGDV